MRLVSIYNCEAGLKIAKPIYDDQNRVLLNEGATLTDSILNRLKSKGISHIYAQTDLTEGIIKNDDVPHTLRFETTKSMVKVFNSLSSDLNSKVAAATHGKLLREFKLVYGQLVKEMKYNAHLLNLLTHLQANSDYLFEHSMNVSIYSLAIARQLYINEDDMYVLGLGAIFHDIGKIKLERDLLHKKAKFTEEEKATMRTHAELGFELLRKERELHLLISHCAYQHHENIDGSGYPRGLKDKEIHLFAKIIGVADMFDSLMRNRREKKALLPHEAMEVLWGYCYKRYDKKILDAFIKSVALYPIGVTVTLNTGEKGVVVGYNDNFPQRPVIRVYTDTKGNKLQEPHDVDMLKHLSIMIEQCDAILDEGKIERGATA
ncbi:MULTISPECIES: HD-GYP domain-containing protein [Cytobacillus]|uniref:Uncharacterized protein n=3 Tax=Bacillati TaxID=1783272 RepID=A0A2N0Z982_9BACI|nr:MULTISPECIES: HD-GYP domain-containing protein [Cytobacillus]MDK7667360.1 HD-GYP domain-containing protein [Cytobacillus oceanisediminis]MEC1157788.1 HD-GYP domain-containing protein [Cytobacillus horneckiae]PKG26078.1 hypothetical protein CWS20_25900 [Cytobacillus horneckiae]